MLFYFSGTGNSTFVATTLANFLQLKLKFIPEIDIQTLSFQGERILFVFPVYSWGVPPLVSKFISDLGDEFWTQIKDSTTEVDCVMTCGDEVAKAPEMIQSDFNKFGIKLNSISTINPFIVGIPTAEKTADK